MKRPRSERLLLVRLPAWVLEEFDELLDATAMRGHGEVPRSEAVAALIHSAYRTNDWIDPDPDHDHYDDSFAGNTMRSYRLERIERDKAVAP